MTLKQIKLFNLFVLAFALSFVIFIVFPKGREIFDLQKTIELTKLKILNGNRALMHQDTLEKQVNIQSTLLEKAKTSFIRENEQPQVYQIINETARQAQVDILSLKPQPQDMSEDLTLGPILSYRQLPLRIEATGRFKNLAYFAHALTHSGKYFSINEMTLQNSDNKTDPIKATFIMNEYLLGKNE